MLAADLEAPPGFGDQPPPYVGTNLNDGTNGASWTPPTVYLNERDPPPACHHDCITWGADTCFETKRRDPATAQHLSSPFVAGEMGAPFFQRYYYIQKYSCMNTTCN